MPAKAPKPVTIDGVTYNSYSQAEKTLGLPKGSVSKMMAKERVAAEEISNAVEAVLEDEAIEATDAEHAAVGEMSTPDEPTEEPSREVERPLIYADVEYKTRREMADALDVEYLKLNAYLRKYEDIDVAVEKCMSGETSLSVTYDGVMHRSFKALCDTYAIAPALVRQVAAANGADKMDTFSDLAALRTEACVRDDITLSFIPHSVVQGVPYKSVKALAEQAGVEPGMMAECVAEAGLPAAIRRLQGERVTEFSLNGSGKKISLATLISEIESGELEHFDLTRHTAPKFPALQGIDISSECYEVEPVRDSIGSGRFALEHQTEPEQTEGQAMASL